MTDSNLVANAVVASANSQYISIVPENGEQFTPGQKIIYNIEPEVGFIKKDSYLVFDVLNTSSDNSRVCFQKNLGAHAIIDRVDIFSKETGVLLESNTHYAQWCNIENQYMYDSTNNLSNHQGVGTPVQSWTHSLSDTNAETRNRSLAGAHKIENNQLSPTDDTPRACFITRRFCIPLAVGLFGAYDASEKAIPIMPFGGLRIEITLQNKTLALQDLALREKDTVNGGEDGDKLTDLRTANTCKDDATDQSTGGGSLNFTIERTDATAGFTKNLQDTGLCVGNTISFTYTDATPGTVKTATGTITAIEGQADKDVVIDGETIELHGELKITFDVNNGATMGATGYTGGSFVKLNSNNNYKVMGTEFRLCQVVPPPDVMDSLTKGINYEYTGYEVFFDNIPTGSLRHQIPIHSVASKAIATFTQLYDTVNDEGQTESSADFYNGSLPDDNYLDEVVYFINNRLYPLRSYKPHKHKDKVLATNELVKAFKALGKQPLNLGSGDFNDLNNYTNTPLIARELARNGMVFDLRNAEPELRLTFTQARGNILRANTYVFSKKIVQTSPTGVQVIH